MKRKTSDLLFATDMDDTLLNSKKEITVENQRAIAEFIKDGGHFVIATGRAVPATEPYVKQLGIQEPCILYNGAGIYDFEQHRFLWTASLPETARGYLKDILDMFPAVGAEILYGDQIYVVRKNKYVSWHVDVEHLEYQELSPDELPDGWFKVLFVMDSTLQDEVWQYMQGKAYPDVVFIKSSEIYLEMMPLGVSKGDTLLRLAQLVGVKQEHTAAIGDYNNDIELIQKAAVGFAVANAPDEIRQIADVVAPDCNHDAVAWALHYIHTNASEKFGTVSTDGERNHI